MGEFRALWRLAGMAWPFAGSGQYFPRAGTLLTFLLFLFFLFFAVAWLFGVSPSEVTAWLGAHGEWWRWIGDALWRICWGLVLLVCAVVLFAIWQEFFGKRADDKQDIPRDYRGGGCVLLVMPFVIYIAWVAITLPG